MKKALLHYSIKNCQFVIFCKLTLKLAQKMYKCFSKHHNITQADLHVWNVHIFLPWKSSSFFIWSQCKMVALVYIIMIDQTSSGLYFRSIYYHWYILLGLKWLLRLRKRWFSSIIALCYRVLQKDKIILL